MYGENAVFLKDICMRFPSLKINQIFAAEQKGTCSILHVDIYSLNLGGVFCSIHPLFCNSFRWLKYLITIYEGSVDKFGMTLLVLTLSMNTRIMEQNLPNFSIYSLLQKKEKKKKQPEFLSTVA